MSIIISRSYNSKQRELDNFKNKAIEKFNKEIGIARSKIMSPVFGQDYVYNAKYNEALDYQANGNTNVLPFLEKEAVVKGVTVETLANEVLTKKQEADTKLADLEALRFDYKDRVNGSTSIEELSVVEASFEIDINNIT